MSYRSNYHYHCIIIHIDILGFFIQVRNNEKTLLLLGSNRLSYQAMSSTRPQGQLCTATKL